MINQVNLKNIHNEDTLLNIRKQLGEQMLLEDGEDGPLVDTIDPHIPDEESSEDGDDDYSSKEFKPLDNTNILEQFKNNNSSHTNKRSWNDMEELDSHSSSEHSLPDDSDLNNQTSAWQNGIPLQGSSRALTEEENNLIK